MDARRDTPDEDHRSQTRVLGRRDLMKLGAAAVASAVGAQKVQAQGGLQRSACGARGRTACGFFPRLRELQHPMRHVEAHRALRARRRAEQDVSGAAREIEHAIVRGDLRQAHEALLPAPVLAVGEKSCDEVVAIGDGGEEAPHVAALAVWCGEGRAKGQSTFSVPFIIKWCGRHTYS